MNWWRKRSGGLALRGDLTGIAGRFSRPSCFSNPESIISAIILAYAVPIHPFY